MARIACVHGPYQGQKATSGNFAMPTAPQEIEMGPVSEFNIYHLMTIDNPKEPFSCVSHMAEGSGECIAVDKALGPGDIAPPRTKVDNSVPSLENQTKIFAFAPNQLGNLATIIRTKNAGPFEVTFDAIFDSQAVYERVKASGVLTRSKVAEALSVDESSILVSMWWDQALAFKATFVRKMVSGGFGETDMHSSCQHVPLMEIEIPPSAKEVLGRPMSSASYFSRSLVGWCTSQRAGRLSVLMAAFSLASLIWSGKLSIGATNLGLQGRK